MVLVTLTSLLGGIPANVASGETHIATTVIVEDWGYPLEHSLVRLSVEQAELIGEYASNEQYLELMAGSTSYSDAMAVISKTHVDLPNKAVVVQVPKKTVGEVVEMMGGKLPLSAKAAHILHNKVMGAMPIQMIAMQGVEAVVISSMLTVSGASVLLHSFDGVSYVVLVYDDLRVVTFFSAANEPVVTYSSWPFVYTDKDMLSSDMNDTDLTQAVLESLNLSVYAAEIAMDILSQEQIAGIVEAR